MELAALRSAVPGSACGGMLVTKRGTSSPGPSQRGFLFDLPHELLHAILHRAGPRSRQLCRALLDSYGPLPRLTPRGVQTQSDLVAALAREDNRHLHLAVLDLSHADILWYDGVHNTLVALCTALPNLRTLRLPSFCHATAACVAAVTSHLSSLTALHAPDLLDAPALPAWPTQGCAHLEELTLPAPLAAAPSAAPCFTSLSKLSFHGGYAIDVSAVASLVDQLPALVTLELGHGYNPGFRGVAHLQTLTQLTALKLKGEVAQPETTGQLLEHVGTLAGLRSLVLQLEWKQELDAAAPNWLTRLALLTHLRVDFFQRSAPGAGGTSAFNEVASLVPHLPALRKLHMASTNGRGAALSQAACARVASAGSSLQQLHLGRLSLPAGTLSGTLMQLTGLTCLRLISVVSPPMMSFSWLTGMTALRELAYDQELVPPSHVCLLPCALLAGLSHVDTLALADCPFVDGPYLERLCASMPQLRSLNLRGNGNVNAGLPALQRLTNLEVLGLKAAEGGSALWLGQVTAPSSLRRCHVGGGGGRAEWQLLGRHVELLPYCRQDWLPPNDL